MPYVISASRKQFDLQLKDIRKKLKVADKKQVPVDLREYAIAAAIFLAHAEIENYFTDVLARIAMACGRGFSNASELPARFRSHLIVERLNLRNLSAKLAGNAGEQDVLSVVDRWFSSSSSFLIDSSEPFQALSGADIYGDYGYPSIKNVEKILKRLGIGDPKGQLNRTVGKDVVGYLEPLASLRTALAHSASLPGVSCKDVMSRLDQVSWFVVALDRLLHSHFQSGIKYADWKVSMC